MTNEELDILWFKAMRQSAEGDKTLGHYHFAALVAAAEREACAKMFDGEVWAYDYREIAAAIRARGEA